MTHTPWYNQDADYNTNAKSYMDYLARHNKFMKVLVEDYEVFKEILVEEFKQFQLGTGETIQSFQDRLDNIQQEMTDLFTVWVNDGTITHLINEEIFSMKADKIDLEELEDVLRTHYDGELNQLTDRLDLFNLLNVKSFAVTGDGVTDDTEGFKEALSEAETQGKTLFIPQGTYAVNTLDINVPLDINGQVEFIFNGNAGDTLLTIHTDHTHFQPLKLDGDDQDCTLLRVTGNHNTFELIDGKNIDAGEYTPNHIFGVMISGNQNTVYHINGEHFINSGYGNESFPQAVLSGGFDNVFHTIVLKDIASGLVTTGTDDNTTLTTVDTLNISNASDNGIYNLSRSSINIGTVVYNGTEEPAVFMGDTVFINTFKVRGQASRIGFQNVKDVRINQLFFEVDEQGRGSNALFRTRTGNTVCERVSIGQISGEIVSDRTGCQLWLLDTGVIEYFTIESLNIVHIYTGAYNAITRYAELLACQQFKISNVRIKIVDLDDQFTSDDVFIMRVPTLIKHSYFDGLTVDMVKQSGASYSPAQFRGTGFDQALLTVNDMTFQANIGPYVRETTYGANQTVNIKPSTGYWHKNDVYYNNFITADSPIGWICIESGSPGVWREL